MAGGGELLTYPWTRMYLLSADELWTSDLRQREFKEVEQTRRNQARARWKGIVGWSWSLWHGGHALVAFAGIKIMGCPIRG